MNKVWIGLSWVGMAGGFLWMALVWGLTNQGEPAVFAPLVGMALVGLTFIRRPAIHTWWFWLSCAVWSVAAIYSLGLSVSPVHAAHVPLWMNVTAPYVFGACPLIVVWFSRAALSIFVRQ